LRGCLKKARVGGGGIGYVLVPGRTERGQNFATDRTGAIDRGMLTATVDAERGGGIATSYHRLLEASFRTPVISTPVGGTVVEQSADWAGLSLFFAQGRRVTKTPALPALRRLGGAVGGSDRAGTGKKTNGFAEKRETWSGSTATTTEVVRFSALFARSDCRNLAPKMGTSIALPIDSRSEGNKSAGSSGRIESARI